MKQPLSVEYCVVTAMQVVKNFKAHVVRVSVVWCRAAPPIVILHLPVLRGGERVASSEEAYTHTLPVTQLTAALRQ